MGVGEGGKAFLLTVGLEFGREIENTFLQVPIFEREEQISKYLTFSD
jgi:hypothetical protein